MRKRTTAVAALLLLALTGCSAPAGSAPSGPESNAESASESPAPLAAETPDAEPSADTPEGEFLSEVRAALGADSQIPDATDARLLAAAEEACQQLESGKSPEEVRVIDGEEPDGLGWYSDSGKIASLAQQILCG